MKTEIRLLLISFLLCATWSAQAAVAISTEPVATSVSPGDDVVINATNTSAGTWTTKRINVGNLKTSLGINLPMAVTSGGTGTNDARSAGFFTGTRIFSDVGGFNGLSYLSATPAFEGQIGTWYNGTHTAEMQYSGSTSAGDWNHGFNFPTGIQQIGSPDSEDPTITSISISVNGDKSLWNAPGDGLISAIDWSANNNNSGSGYNIAIMRDGFGLTNFTIVSGGSGYAVNDLLAITGGTVFNGVVARLIVSSVSSGVVTGAKIFATGEYITTNTGTVSATGGSGSGFTCTCAFATKAVHAKQDNSASLMHVPANRIESLINGWMELVQNADAVHNRGLVVCGPNLSGFDSGNYAMEVWDMINGVTGFPWWQSGLHSPTNAAFKYALWVTHGTGNVYATNNLIVVGTTTAKQYVGSQVAISASAIDWSAGTHFSKTLGANTTFTFSNATDTYQIVVAITDTASNWTVTWPGGIKWTGGSAPVQTVGAHTDVYTFVQINGTIYGSAVQNF